MVMQSQQAEIDTRNQDGPSVPPKMSELPALQSVLDVLPPDGKGWMVLNVAPRNPMEAPEVLKVKITSPNGIVKVISLVRQLTTLRIHVNPDPQGFDEWKMDGQMYKVLSEPKPQEERTSSTSSTNSSTASGEEMHLPRKRRKEANV